MSATTSGRERRRHGVAQGLAEDRLDALLQREQEVPAGLVEGLLAALPARLGVGLGVATKLAGLGLGLGDDAARRAPAPRRRCPAASASARSTPSVRMRSSRLCKFLCPWRSLRSRRRVASRAGRTPAVRTAACRAPPPNDLTSRSALRQHPDGDVIIRGPAGLLSRRLRSASVARAPSGRRGDRTWTEAWRAEGSRSQVSRFVGIRWPLRHRLRLRRHLDLLRPRRHRPLRPGRHAHPDPRRGRRLHRHRMVVRGGLGGHAGGERRRRASRGAPSARWPASPPPGRCCSTPSSWSPSPARSSRTT